MIKKRKRQLIILSLIAIAIIVSAYFLQKSSSKSFDLGDFQQDQLRYQDAIHSYDKAAMLWPFIKRDPKFQEALSTAKASFEEKGTILFTILFSEDATEAEIEGLAEELRKQKEIKTVKVISQEEALKIYQEENKEDPLLLGYLTKEIFPVTMEVYTQTVQSEEYQEKIVTFVKSKTFVLEVDKPNKAFD